MIRWSMCGVYLILVLSGCGQEVGPGNMGCEPQPQRVMLDVAADYPGLLEDSVCSVAGSLELEAFLLMPDEVSCFVSIEMDGIRGCCPVDGLNRSLSATLVVRTLELEALIESTQLLTIPGEGEVVDVQFDAGSFSGSMYDADRDGQTNIEEYCAGTL